MTARNPWRALLGRGVALVAGLSPEEGAEAVAIAEDVRDKVKAGAEVVRRLRGRSSRGGGELAPRSASSGRELVRGEVVDAEVVEDAPSSSAVPAVVVVGQAPEDAPRRRSRYE